MSDELDDWENARTARAERRFWNRVQGRRRYYGPGGDEGPRIRKHERGSYRDHEGRMRSNWAFEQGGGPAPNCSHRKEYRDRCWARVQSLLSYLPWETVREILEKER